jgi:hypothetical protein
VIIADVAFLQIHLLKILGIQEAGHASIFLEWSMQWKGASTNACKQD